MCREPLLYQRNKCAPARTGRSSHFEQRPCGTKGLPGEYPVTGEPLSRKSRPWPSGWARSPGPRTNAAAPVLCPGRSCLDCFLSTGSWHGGNLLLQTQQPEPGSRAQSSETKPSSLWTFSLLAGEKAGGIVLLWFLPDCK